MRIARTAITLGIATAAIATSMSTALADPPSGVTPAVSDIVGVGSDTSQNLLDQIATDYDAMSPTNSLYSWDAVGSANITTKATCASIVRPNGSGAGISALKSNAKTSDKAHYCVDFARSSRGPQAGDGTAIAFVRAAQDAVTWSSTSTASKPTNAPASLSIQQLQAIYTCDASVLGAGGSGPVTWNEVGGTGTAAVVPVIPQSASGTRSFFLKAIGVTTLGSCVQGQDNSVEENEGTNAIFKSASAPNIVFPYSVAVYLAQSQNGHGTGTQGKQRLGSATATDGTVVKPVVGKFGSYQLNPQLAIVGLTRYIYDVVRNVGTSHIPSNLKTIFGSTGYVCKNATAKADITSYGFRTITTCGTVEIATS